MIRPGEKFYRVVENAPVAPPRAPAQVGDPDAPHPEVP
jgi:cell division protein FtsB